MPDLEKKEETTELNPPANFEETQVPNLEAPKGEEGNTSPHPLQEGGRRFEQVYAQKKQTERELADERDKRIRLEAQLELLKKGETETAQVYTWEQLNPMIASGQITMTQAQAHREAVLRQEIKQEVTREYRNETSALTKEQTLGQEIFSYIQSAPNLKNQDDPVRQKLDDEFDYLVELHGHDASKMTPVQRKTLELTALRTVLGPRESLTKRMAPMEDTHQGLPRGGGNQRPSNVNPDQKLLDALTPREVAHYNRAIKRGHYADGWKGVVAELKFQRPTR